MVLVNSCPPAVHPADEGGRWHLIAKDTKYAGFDLRVMTDARVLDASRGPPSAPVAGALGPPPSVVASSLTSLRIDEAYGNINGVMHGGAYGVIFDMLTTVALAVVGRPGYWEYASPLPPLTHPTKRHEGHRRLLTTQLVSWVESRET